MTADFRSLLTKKADDFKRPPTLPPGTYHAVLAARSFDVSSQKKTPFVRYTVKINSPGPDISLEQLLDPTTGQAIDLSKRELRQDFYLTDSATYRINEFADKIGAASGWTHNGHTLEEVVEFLVGKPVLITVTLKPNTQKPDEPPYAEIGDIGPDVA